MALLILTLMNNINILASKIKKNNFIPDHNLSLLAKKDIDMKSIARNQAKKSGLKKKDIKKLYEIIADLICEKSLARKHMDHPLKGEY